VAFENIGIGGVLSFDSRAAVTNMSLAERAFNTLGRAAAGVQAGVAKVGSGLSSAFGGLATIGTGAIVGVGAGIAKWVHEGISFNKEMEISEISIATILAAIKKTPLSSELETAKTAMTDLTRVAAEAPGELSDIISIFQLMVGPMTVGKATMEDIFKSTKGTAILAGALKRPFNDTAQAMSKLAAGNLELGSDIHLMLKSMGLLKEETAEWKALLPEQRAKRILEILQAFEESGKLVGQTWEATSSTTSSIMKEMAGAFTRKLFDNMTKGLTSFNDKFMNNRKEWLGTAARIGEAFGSAIQFVGATLRGFVEFAVAQVNRIQGAFDKLGTVVDRSVLERFAEIGLQIGITAVALSPVITIVGFIGSKLMAVVSIVSGLASILAAVAVPLLVIVGIVGGLFMLFRREGETPMQTLGRALDKVREIGERLWAAVQGSMDTLRGAVGQLQASFQALWSGIQPGLESARSAIAGIVEFMVRLVEHLIPILASLFAGMVRVFEALRPGIEAVFNGVMKVVNVVVEGLNYILPKIMAVLRPIIEVLISVGEKIAMVFGKIMSALEPVFNALAYVLKEIIFPVAGWLIDTFGPVFVAIWKAVGWVVNKILDGIGLLIDGVKAVLGVVGGALKAAFEFIRDIVKWIADKLSWVADKVSWVGKKLGGIASKLGFGGGGALKTAMDAIKNQQAAKNGGKDFWTMAQEAKDKAVADQQAAAKAAIGKPTAAVNTAITGSADIKAKQPDLNVAVKVENKSTMCVDGRNLAVAQGKYETEVSERSGYNKTPWQNQRVQITGVK
jgi:phage-related protein